MIYYDGKCDDKLVFFTSWCRSVFPSRSRGLKLQSVFKTSDALGSLPFSPPLNLLITVHLLFKFLKKHHCLSGKLKTEFTSPIAKFTSRTLSDTTLFANDLSDLGSLILIQIIPKEHALSVGRIIATGKKLSDDRLAGLQSNQHHTQKMC